MIEVFKDRVLAEPILLEEKTGGGIIIPLSHRHKTSYARVIKSKHHEIQDGDKILYVKDKGVEVEDEGKKYLLIRAADIFATVEEG